jgi:hypothetical protein
VQQHTSMTLINTSQEEEQKEGWMSEMTTRMDRHKRKRKSSQFQDWRLGGQIQEVYLGEQSWNGEQKKCK